MAALEWTLRTQLQLVSLLMELLTELYKAESKTTDTAVKWRQLESAILSGVVGRKRDYFVYHFYDYSSSQNLNIKTYPFAQIK